MNFEYELEKAKNKVNFYKSYGIINNKSIDIEEFKKYIKEVSQKENIYGEELREKISKEYNDMLYEYLKISGTRTVQKQVQATKMLNNNPYILDNIYEKVKDLDLSKIDFGKRALELKGEEKEFEENELCTELKWIREEREFINQSIIEKYKKMQSEKSLEKRKMYQKELERKYSGKEVMKTLSIFAADTEKEQLANSLKFREKELEQFMLKNQKEHFKKAGEFLIKYNKLNQYVEMQNKDYEKMQMPGMKYTEEEAHKIFTDEYIDKLEPLQLAILNAFWQNRFTKEAIKFGEDLFIFDTLNLWENYENTELDEEKLKIVLQKENICDRAFYKIKDNIGETVKEKTFSYGLINLSNIPEQFKNEYKEYFDKQLPESKNIMENDVVFGQNKRNIENVIYKTKASMIQELLLDIEHNKNITNWGYVPEIHNGKNSIQNDKKHILISIDYPGFNMPLRLHTEKETIEEFLEIRKNSTIIPIYEGNQDFKYRGEMLSTKLFMPLTEQGESEIIKQNKSINATDTRYGYVKHLGNLVTKKVKAIKKIFPSRYVDLSNGEEGIKVNNKFIPNKTIDENNKIR